MFFTQKESIMVSFGYEDSKHLQVRVKNQQRKRRGENLSSCFIMIAGEPQVVRTESYKSYILKNYI